MITEGDTSRTIAIGAERSKNLFVFFFLFFFLIGSFQDMQIFFSMRLPNDCAKIYSVCPFVCLVSQCFVPLKNILIMYHRRWQIIKKRHNTGAVTIYYTSSTSARTHTTAMVYLFVCLFVCPIFHDSCLSSASCVFV